MSLANYANNCCPTQFADGTNGQVLGMSGGNPTWIGASGIVITDAGGYFATDNVEAALQQLAAASVNCEQVQDCVGGAMAISRGLVYNDAANTFETGLNPLGGIEHNVNGDRLALNNLPASTAPLAATSRIAIAGDTTNNAASIATYPDVLSAMITAAADAATCTKPTHLLGEDAAGAPFLYNALFTASDQSAARPGVPITAITAGSTANVDINSGIGFLDSNDIIASVATPAVGCGASVQFQIRPYYYHVAGGLNQNITPAGTITKITGFTVGPFSNNINLVNDDFVVVVAGIYEVTAELTWHFTTDWVHQNAVRSNIYVFVNGVNIEQLDARYLTEVATAESNNIGGTTLLNLNAGDLVSIRASHADIVNVTHQVRAVFASIQRISGA